VQNRAELLSELQAHVNKRRDAIKNSCEDVKEQAELEIKALLEGYLSSFGITKQDLEGKYWDDLIDWLIQKGLVK